MVIIYIVAITFSYIFSCVIAYKVMKSMRGWSATADTPGVACWPVILLFYILIIWPIVGMVWLVNDAPRKLRQRRKSVSEVK